MLKSSLAVVRIYRKSNQSLGASLCFSGRVEPARVGSEGHLCSTSRAAGRLSAKAGSIRRFSTTLRREPPRECGFLSLGPFLRTRVRHDRPQPARIARRVIVQASRALKSGCVGEKVGCSRSSARRPTAAKNSCVSTIGSPRASSSHAKSRSVSGRPLAGRGGVFKTVAIVCTSA